MSLLKKLLEREDWGYSTLNYNIHWIGVDNIRIAYYIHIMASLFVYYAKVENIH